MSENGWNDLGMPEPDEHGKTEERGTVDESRAHYWGGNATAIGKAIALYMKERNVPQGVLIDSTIRQYGIKTIPRLNGFKKISTITEAAGRDIFNGLNAKNQKNLRGWFNDFPWDEPDPEPEA